MAIDAVKRVRTVVDGRVEVDVKRYARVEKIPGGEMEDCKVRCYSQQLCSTTATATRAAICVLFLPTCLLMILLFG